MAARPDFVVYIDEAGDPGVKAKVSGSGGASEWFVVSAVVVAADRDRDAVDWVRDMREAVRAQQRSPLHYRNLSQSNKERVCRMLSTKSVRLFTVASHKTNMRDRQNPRMGKPLGRGEFYNWCLRLLLERVTAWCARRAQKHALSSGSARIVFSERGGHDYDHLRAYLALLDEQARVGGAVLKQRQIARGIIAEEMTEVRRHDDLAGLQLADICASAFFQAINGKTPEDLKPALALADRVAKEGTARSAAEFGLLRLPFPTHGQIPVECQPIFKRYGYVFPRG